MPDGLQPIYDLRFAICEGKIRVCAYRKSQIQNPNDPTLSQLRRALDVERPAGGALPHGRAEVGFFIKVVQDWQMTELSSAV
jgi:hypothetical protein